MAILKLDQHELEIIQMALSCSKMDLKLNQGVKTTPTIDGIAKKVNEALFDLQRDIDFEKSLITEIS